MGTSTHTAGAKPPAPGAASHPLGPLVYRVTADKPAAARMVGLLVVGGAVAILGVAGWLEPDPSGTGTHRQLGIAACAAEVITGYPCPTCGMTTAFAHTVRGQWISAFHAQPAGFALALATVVAGALALGVLVTGRVWGVNWYRIKPRTVTLTVLGVLLAGWVYKIATTVGIGGAL